MHVRNGIRNGVDGCRGSHCICLCIRHLEVANTMNIKAGQLFRCVCCGETHDEQEAAIDTELKGPVCEDCRKHLRAAGAWMQECFPTLAEKQNKFRVRPVTKDDINNDNYKRFMP